ncbi:unnamed protein product [Microthlaspi erraticum]|uniref:GST C-terminal domain-containing protein n=1 Tax=Microthlaspi erraticum TaxID=1685480 RepID=A0A6D2JNQ0_9BRAS|nr:unnamed protein product [Microthlaspi erraticum]
MRTLLKCNFAPYGKDFPGKIATGRFSDGRVPSEIIAERLGITKTIPAYLDPTLKNEDLIKGINFASGGSGYDPLTSKIVELYGLGARRIGVFSAVPVGCVPARRTLTGIKRTCSDKLNNMALQFNAKLSPSLEALGKESPGSKIVFINVYDILLDMIENPKNYDPPAALYYAAETWVDALNGRPYLGESTPNLADLAVFGVLRPIRYLRSGKYMVDTTHIGEWYSRMENTVGEPSRIKEE